MPPGEEDRKGEDCRELLKHECQQSLACFANHSPPRYGSEDSLPVVKMLEAAQQSISNGSTQEVIQW